MEKERKKIPYLSLHITSDEGTCQASKGGLFVYFRLWFGGVLGCKGFDLGVKEVRGYILGIFEEVGPLSSWCAVVAMMVRGHRIVTIITGGASGIGKATACLFANHGAHVVIADIQDELGQQVAASIGSKNCSYIHCDVTDEEQVKAMVEWTVQNHGRLDIMFSNAGMIHATKKTSNSNQNILDIFFVAFDRLFSVNVRGMAACVKQAARAMVDKQVRGSIICTASVCVSSGGEMDFDYLLYVKAFGAGISKVGEQTAGAAWDKGKQHIAVRGGDAVNV
ncbi:(-)-isopiperitenol/(-)-carveol dehydrogenase [Hibiscus syriacus]|uniref:(-)-isopiperitenol/(-)-carveol dehydrogenase n=1 Tax=Hibiscus syriacus TaxID=106335 RepID=A0A6A2ZZD7_HIBSY|nr:(-)-isopiperitenol/(-)-carveol dehydrogenase [Hibiscus syriacus]